MKVSFPAAAPTTPPDIGASMNLPWPDEWAALATSAEERGSMVEQSMKRRSWFTPSRRSVGGLSIDLKTFWTWDGPGSAVMIVSCFSTISLPCLD